jgi:hypothetical protein
MRNFEILVSIEVWRKLRILKKPETEIRFQDGQQTVIHQTEKKAVSCYWPWRRAKEA